MAGSDVLQLVGNSHTISATSTSASVTIPTQDAASSENVCVYNAGPSDTFIAIGTASATAVVTTSAPVPAGSVLNFYKGPHDTFAAVCNSGLTATVYFTPGNGQ